MANEKNYRMIHMCRARDNMHFTFRFADANICMRFRVFCNESFRGEIERNDCLCSDDFNRQEQSKYFGLFEKTKNNGE